MPWMVPINEIWAALMPACTTKNWDAYACLRQFMPHFLSLWRLSTYINVGKFEKIKKLSTGKTIFSRRQIVYEVFWQTIYHPFNCE